MSLLRNPFALPKQIYDELSGQLGGATALAKIVAKPHTPVLLGMSAFMIAPLYRASFLAGAASSGVLRALGARPCDLESLADLLGIEDKVRLSRWLDAGVRLGELGTNASGCYRLRSVQAKVLARLDHDMLGAGLEEVLRYHVPALLDGPAMLQRGKLFSLADQDGTVIARATRVIQPLVEQALERELDRHEPVRLLEVGCGSGVYVRHAATLNPNLTALAIDMQADVVTLARRNIASWGLSDRVEVRQGDLRELDLQPQFDLITLHNNIYYFAEDTRVATLRKVRSLLSPGGKLLLTSSCQGGHVSLDMLNLWLEYADFGGPLPAGDALAEQFEAAGFVDVRARRVVPGEQYRAFVGVNP